MKRTPFHERDERDRGIVSGIGVGSTRGEEKRGGGGKQGAGFCFCCRAGELTSEVGGPGFRGPKVTPSKNGKVIGFDQLFFDKGPIYEND